MSAVVNRAFVFAASPHFVAGNCSTRCRGAVSVGALSPARGNASKKFLRRFEGMPASGKLTSDGRIILSDEGKGVSL